MSSRSLAAARARRSGENPPPVSGNRPITSIGSQAAFAQQMPNEMSYNMPPPPNNVRTSKTMQSQKQQNQSKSISQQYNQFYEQQTQSQQLPFNKISISDAIGLITLRLGRVEQWIIESEHETESNQNSISLSNNISDNEKIIDSSVLNNIINRIDVLEKNNGNNFNQTEEITKLTDEIKQIREQITKISNDTSKHMLDISKNTEQVLRFNRELTETKDILKSFMVKYDLFAQEISQNFNDYETALSDLEKKITISDEIEYVDEISNSNNETIFSNNNILNSIDENVSNSEDLHYNTL
jgi:hypothetical protein